VIPRQSGFCDSVVSSISKSASKIQDLTWAEAIWEW
jgi:hypothetical protein